MAEHLIYHCKVKGLYPSGTGGEINCQKEQGASRTSNSSSTVVEQLPHQFIIKGLSAIAASSTRIEKMVKEGGAVIPAVKLLPLTQE